MITKKERLIQINDVITKISDSEFLYDVWVQGKYFDRVSSYIEAVSTLEDYNIETVVYDKWEEYGISGRVKENLIELLTLLDFDGHLMHPKDLLDDPRWLKIQAKAKMVSDELQEVIDSMPEE